MKRSRLAALEDFVINLALPAIGILLLVCGPVLLGVTCGR